MTNEYEKQSEHHKEHTKNNCTPIKDTNMIWEHMGT
jgi:hypothetical protein